MTPKPLNTPPNATSLPRELLLRVIGRNRRQHTGRSAETDGIQNAIERQFADRFGKRIEKIRQAHDEHADGQQMAAPHPVGHHAHDAPNRRIWVISVAKTSCPEIVPC